MQGNITLGKAIKELKKFIDETHDNVPPGDDIEARFYLDIILKDLEISKEQDRKASKLLAEIREWAESKKFDRVVYGIETECPWLRGKKCA